MTRKQTHWSYGSGMPGCLYDNGPHFVATRADAIDGALLPFLDDLPEHDYAEAKLSLAEQGIYYFPVALRAELGAVYCEVSEQPGPCPDSDG